jgi:hypothetical protein
MTPDADRLISRFFTAPNEIDAARLPDEVASLVGQLLARARSHDRPRTVLPARIDAETRWYGVAQTAAEGRQLREEMRSWLGAPITSGVAQVPSNSADQVDQVALEIAGPHGVALVAHINPKYLRPAREAMQQLLSLWAVSPSRQHSVPRPVGRVLRDFYEAILVRDRSAAENALDEVRSRGLLTATNARFLLVELLGSLGTPQDLRDDPRLAQISLVRRPPRITETLARAADRLFIGPDRFIDRAALRQIAEELEECWPGLVIHAAQVRSVESARCLAVVESISELPRPSIVSYLQSNWGHDTFVEQVLRLLAPAGAETPEADPFALIAAGDLEAALARCEALPATTANVGAAVFAAHELGLMDGAVRALRLVDSLPADESKSLLSQAVQVARVGALRELAIETTTAGDWLAWLRSPAGPESGRLDLLSEWALAVPVDSATLTPRYVDEILIELIDALNDSRRPVVRDALPILLASLTRDGGLRPEAVRLATEIADVVLSSGAGAVERALALDIMDAAFECGCTAQEYRHLLESVGSHFEEIGPRSISFVADAVSLVLDASVQDRGSRETFVARGFAAASRALDRLDPDDALVLRHVFRAAGSSMPEASGSAETLPPRGHSLRVVGIYSLEEPAARRAASWIAELVDGVDVRLSHDHVNSDRLASAVRSVQVMLVQTSRATHAATNAISVAALGHTPIVHVNGRGASALLREFVRWLGSP